MFGLANITNTVLAITFNYFPDFWDIALLFTVTGKTNYAVSLTDSVTKLARIFSLPSTCFRKKSTVVNHCMDLSKSKQVKNCVERKAHGYTFEMVFSIEHFKRIIPKKNQKWTTTAWSYQSRNKFKNVWCGRLMVIPLKWYSV